MKASRQLQPVASRRSVHPQVFLDRLLSAVSRHNARLLLFMICFGVAIVGVFVVRDLQTASAEAQKMYSGAVQGLQQIGELQYYAQETRRATLYALTTSDSNLQVEYADQSRAADQRVKDGIAEYGRQAKSPQEVALATRLSRDWTGYLNVRDEVLASILEGSTKEAVILDLSGGVPAFENIRQDLNEVKRMYDADASQRLTNLKASSRRSFGRLTAILGFTFLLSCGAIWTIQKSRMLSAIQLAKLQMEFVASVSHELRTPLAVLSSAADNIADGLIEEKGALRKYGAILQKQSRSMNRLVDEILLFASTEDQNNRYVMKSVETSQMIDTVLGSSERLVRGAGFAIDRYIEQNLPAVLGDESGIAQCLENLISNAVKYGGGDRRIVLRAFVAPIVHRAGIEVRISIEDHGIGIDPSEMAKIFEPFYRSPRVVAAQIHGTGLGLSLARRIAEAIGGRLSVASEVSAGTVFTLHLQIAKGKDMQTAAATSWPASSFYI